MSQILIVRDFNIHVCCSSNPLARDFFTQFVSGPTHKQGYSLDLVLSLGLPVSNMEICDVFFFLTTVPLCLTYFYPIAILIFLFQHPVFKPSATGQFSIAFKKVSRADCIGF